MARRLQMLGVILSLIGLGFVVAGGVAFYQVQKGYDSLQSFSEAQNVQLSYNEDGQLVDRGTTEGADAIMDLLVEDWGYPVNEAHLDPNDPVVNTASEYMYQMATIGYHVLHGTQTVVLDEAVEYEGTVYEPGTYEFEVDGRYWTDFDRMHPIEGPARGQAWSGTAHGLFAELGVGTVTASTLQMGLGLSGLFAGVGLLALVAGLGMIWVARSKEEFGGIQVTSPEMPKTKTPTS